MQRGASVVGLVRDHVPQSMLFRNGMADQYEGKLPFGQAGPIYVKDVEGFAGQAGIDIDGQPTVVLVTPDGILHERFKGEATEANVAAVLTAAGRHAAAE